MSDVFVITSTARYDGCYGPHFCHVASTQAKAREWVDQHLAKTCDHWYIRRCTPDGEKVLVATNDK